MKLFYTFLIWLLFLKVDAQDRPQYVPFMFEGKVGVMSVSGSILLEPGYFESEGKYFLTEDFKRYIIRDNSGQYVVLDARSGKETIVGQLDTDCGPLRMAEQIYYHFHVAGASMLISGKETRSLGTKYKSIEPSAQSWANERLGSRQFIFALKQDNIVANDRPAELPFFVSQALF